jgi:hypothetical protein
LRTWRALRFPSADACTVLDCDIPGLSSIPNDADLFATRKYDVDAAIALASLDQRKGITVATASSLLHQKRSGMFPIFDAVVCRALNIPREHEGRVTTYQQMLERYRSALAVGNNGAVFDAICDRIRDGAVQHFLGKPRVPVLDALAWSLIYYHDPFSCG